MHASKGYFSRPLALLMCAAALAASLMAVVLASPAQAAIFAVNSTADTDDGACTTSSGGCTLREAINAANATASEDTINFDLGQSATTILLSSQLPTIPATGAGGPLTIDGENADITISGQGRVQVFQVSSDANLTLANLTVANGNAGDCLGEDAFGGAIFNSGSLEVTNSTFSNNRACLSGGAINNLDTLTVSGSTFSFNSTTEPDGNNFGGGIFNDGVATVSNSTFSGNSSLFGGGISAFDGSLTVTNSTFSDNSAADTRGGGISCLSGSFAGTHNTFTNNTGGNLDIERGCSVFGLSNTILANAIQGSNCSEPITDGGYNISDDASCAFSASTSKNSTNPRLHPKGLRDHGGPTLTIRLLPNSPAIHAIPTSTNGCGTDVTTDQRGILRPQGPGCDIGAFEVEHKKKEKKNPR